MQRCTLSNVFCKVLEVANESLQSLLVRNGTTWYQIGSRVGHIGSVSFKFTWGLLCTNKTNEIRKHLCVVSAWSLTIATGEQIKEKQNDRLILELPLPSRAISIGILGRNPTLFGHDNDKSLLPRMLWSSAAHAVRVFKAWVFNASHSFVVKIWDQLFASCLGN